MIRRSRTSTQRINGSYRISESGRETLGVTGRNCPETIQARSWEAWGDHGPQLKNRKEDNAMQKEPFQIPTILESLHNDVLLGTITLYQAAEELYECNWMNFIDEDKARRLLGL